MFKIGYKTTIISAGTDVTRAQQAGGREGARHSGAPMLRKYATTSALLKLMAYLSEVQP